MLLQSASNNAAANNVTITLGSTPSVGDFIFVVVTANVAAYTSLSVDSGAYGAWTRITGRSASMSIAVYYKFYDGFGTNITIRATGATSIYGAVHSYSNISKIAPIDSSSNSYTSYVNSYYCGLTQVTAPQTMAVVALSGYGWSGFASPSYTNSFTSETSQQFLLTGDKQTISSGWTKTNVNTTVSWTAKCDACMIMVHLRENNHSFVWLEPPAPQNVIATPIAGGSKSVGTYYYRVFGGGWASGQYYWTRAWMTEPSTEVSATTDTTNKTIHLYFDKTTDPVYSYDAGSYGAYISDTSGLYTVKPSGTIRYNLAALTGYDSALWGTVPTTNAGCKSCREMTFSGTIPSLQVEEVLTQATTGATAIVATNPAGTNKCKVQTVTGSWNTSSGYAVTGSVTGLLGVTCTALPSTVVGYVLYDAANASRKQPWLPKGKPTLQLNGGDSADPITPMEIYDWMITNSHQDFIEAWSGYEAGDWKEDFNGTYRDIMAAFLIKCNIISNNTGAYVYFKSAGNTMIFHRQGKLYIGGQTGDFFEMGQYDSTYGRSYQGSVYVGIKSYADYAGIANLNQYGSYLAGAFYPVNYTNPFGSVSEMDSYQGNSNNFIQFSSSGSNKIYDSVLHNTGRLNVSTLDVRRSRMMVGGAEFSTNTIDKSAMNIDKMMIDTRMSAGNAIGEIIVPSAIFIRRVADSYFAATNAYASASTVFTSMYNFIDPIWANNAPAFGCGVTTVNNYDSIFLETATTKILVTDISGNPIQNATVKLSDTNGVTQLITHNDSPPIWIWGPNQFTKSATQITFNSSATLPTVGKNYRFGLERFSVNSLSTGSTYNVTRAIQGSAANNGPYQNSYYSAFHAWTVEDSLLTDANGEITVYPEIRTWAGYNLTTSTTLTNTKQEKNPFRLKVTAPGYKKYDAIVRINPNMGPTYGGPVTIEVILEKVPGLNISKYKN